MKQVKVLTPFVSNFKSFKARPKDPPINPRPIMPTFTIFTYLIFLESPKYQAFIA